VNAWRSSWYFRGADIVSVLDELTTIRDAPVDLRTNNGPEMISRAVKAWCAASRTGTLHIDPGSPWQYCIVATLNS
jgi:putative transposase